MGRHDLKSMSVEELWSLHEIVVSELTRKISDKKAGLDDRLRQLDRGNVSENVQATSRTRRPYPQVFPKYRNPAEPSETWSGRGKQPRWLTAQFTSGKRLEDFSIKPSSTRTPAVRKLMTLISSLRGVSKGPIVSDRGADQ